MRRWRATQQQVIAVDNAGLSPENLAALRESLHEQRLSRQEQLQQIGGASQTRADQVRGQQSASQVEVHIKLAASARMVLADVEAALQRIDQSRYGKYQRCTRPVAVDRLRIVRKPATAPAVSRSERRDGNQNGYASLRTGDNAQTVTLRTGGRS